MPKIFACIVFAIATLPVAACANGKPPVKTGIAPPTRIPDVAAPAGPVGEAVATATVPRDVRRAVVADAAKRFGVEPSAVVLVKAEKVTWSDASLGCAEPGHLYAQMLVEGFRIVAKTQAGSLTYNTDSGGNAIPCGSAGPAGTGK